MVNFKYLRGGSKYDITDLIFYTERSKLSWELYTVENPLSESPLYILK